LKLPENSDTQNVDDGYRGYLGMWCCEEAQENLDTLDGKSYQQTSAARLDETAIFFRCYVIGDWGSFPQQARWCSRNRFVGDDRTTSCLPELGIHNSRLCENRQIITLIK
jgi:hypothetical protein